MPFWKCTRTHAHAHPSHTLTHAPCKSYPKNALFENFAQRCAPPRTPNCAPLAELTPKRFYPQPTPPCKSYPKNALLKVLPRGVRRHGRRIPPLAHTRHLANPIQKHERFEHVIPRTSACKSYPINARFENVIPHTPACKSYPTKCHFEKFDPAYARLQILSKNDRFEHVVPQTPVCKSYPKNARFEFVIPHAPARKSYQILSHKCHLPVPKCHAA